jgi:hypothetical protein
MSRCELEDLYRRAVVGPVPSGFAPGRAIYSPGSRLTVLRSRLTRLLWQGKVFPGDDTMVNRMLGLQVIRADVYYAQSWFDGGQTLVLDYADSSKVWADVRDEMREVAPGLWLGLTYRRRCPEPKLAVFYVIDARGPCCGSTNAKAP